MNEIKQALGPIKADVTRVIVNVKGVRYVAECPSAEFPGAAKDLVAKVEGMLKEVTKPPETAHKLDVGEEKKTRLRGEELKARNAAIKKEKADGKDVKAIAEKFNITPRMVGLILAKD